MKTIKSPTVIDAPGIPRKIIEEFVGQVNTNDKNISIARMKSPKGWSEPGQTPEFDEYTFVINGEVVVESRDGKTIVKKDQLIVTHKGEWVRYSTPDSDAEYIAVCIPAFSPALVHRDEQL